MVVVPVTSGLGAMVARRWYPCFGHWIFGFLANQRLIDRFLAGYAWIAFNIYVALSFALFLFQRAPAAFVENGSYTLQMFILTWAGLGLGWAYAYLNFLFAGGLALLIRPGTLKKGRILTLRRFRARETKVIIEEMLPALMNYFGEFTVIECQGEYARKPQARLSLRPFFSILPTWLPWVNYTEIYLNQIARSTYTIDKWHASVTREIGRARLLVFDLSDFSENVLWELEQAHNSLPPERMVFIAAEGSNSLNSIRHYEAELAKTGHYLSVSAFFYPIAESESFFQKSHSFCARLAQHLFNLEPKSGFGNWLSNVFLLLYTFVGAQLASQGTSWSFTSLGSTAIAVVVMPLALASFKRRQLVALNRLPAIKSALESRPIVPAPSEPTFVGPEDALAVAYRNLDPTLDYEEVHASQASDADEQTASPASYRFCSPFQVGIASMFGTSLAGYLCIAANFSKQGRRKATGWTVALGVASMLMEEALSLYVFTFQGAMLIILTVDFAYMYGVAKLFNGRDYRLHKESGGQDASLFYVVLFAFILNNILPIFFMWLIRRS
jgi:hypothetical protein